MVSDRRDRTEVTADMLRVAKGGALKTALVYGANLNFEIVKGYLARLLKRGLLEHVPPRYYTTPIGEEFIQLQESLSLL